MRAHIIYDSTLSDLGRVTGLIAQARRLGYEIRIIGVTAHPPAAWARSLERGKQGGRYVPFDALLYSHKRFAQLFEGYTALADAAELWKTDGASMGEKEDVLLLAETRNGKLIIVHDAGYRQFQESAHLNENADTPEEIFPGNKE